MIFLIFLVYFFRTTRWGLTFQGDSSGIMPSEWLDGVDTWQGENCFALGDLSTSLEMTVLF